MRNLERGDNRQMNVGRRMCAQKSTQWMKRPINRRVNGNSGAANGHKKSLEWMRKVADDEKCGNG